MTGFMNSRFVSFSAVFSAVLVGGLFCNSALVQAAENDLPFDGEKSAWHEGFERFDYVMDEETLAMKPFKAPEGEKFGVKDPAKGQRRCVVVAPKQAAAGNPWS